MSISLPNPKAGRVIWFVGLSGAGKSTLADALYHHLQRKGILTVRLDGDDLRIGLNSDLGFSPEDRSENLRRAAHVARLFANQGLVTICSFISPLETDRQMIRAIAGESYFEVYVSTSLRECECRDIKGLYRRARSGQIESFTGVSAPFEPPVRSELVVDTEGHSIEESLTEVIHHLAMHA